MWKKREFHGEILLVVI